GRPPGRLARRTSRRGEKTPRSATWLTERCSSTADRPYVIAPASAAATAATRNIADPVPVRVGASRTLLCRPYTAAGLHRLIWSVRVPAAAPHNSTIPNARGAAARLRVVAPQRAGRCASTVAVWYQAGGGFAPGHPRDPGSWQYRAVRHSLVAAGRGSHLPGAPCRGR